MFSALDLTISNQVACYDDGVGTSSFKPLAMLGGAFGIGLRRNVISLYKFACRNFRAPGDEIYAFGFSRGAFTIRVVIGLIIDQGLIPAADISESEPTSWLGKPTAAITGRISTRIGVSSSNRSGSGSGKTSDLRRRRRPVIIFRSSASSVCGIPLQPTACRSTR